MFKKYKKQLIISSIVILLPIVFGLIFWDKLPETFATHWGVDGQPDGFSSKAFAIFFLPLFLVAMQFFCVWITDLTNRGNAQSPKVMNLIFCIVPVLSLITNGMVYAIAMGKVLDMYAMMPILLGALFALIGNYMPKCTQNTTVGIKVIWTLNNEENWNATHRFAGKTWVAAGLIAMLSAFLPTKIGYPIMFVALIGAGAGAALYSYLYYRKQLKLGTAVPIRDIPVDPKQKTINRIVWVIVITILIGAGFLMFSGSIEYDFREDALVMDATFSSPITLRYENIEDIEYREGNVEGVRVGGFGSLRLLLGFFENEEFGTYSRYTYYKPDGCIVVTAKGDTLVFSGADAEETQEIYRELLKRIE
jgi:uncharacterized membrane protein